MANFLKSLFVKGIEIDPAGATSAQVLSYNGTKFVPTTAGVGALGLDDLSDVAITTPATTQFVRYNGTNWVNATISAGDVPTLNQNTTGNASTASAVDATNLTGTTLASGVIGSSLTSVGTLSSLTVTNAINGTLTKTVAGTGTADLIYGQMADNDQFRIRIGGTATNAGYVEIATSDDATEPIYVRQYTQVGGVAFTTLTRTATLLDGSGNTSFPGTITATTYTGAWNGTAIAGQYGGTGVANTGKTITLGGNLTTSGAFTTTLTATANTSVTLPTSGTVATTTNVRDAEMRFLMEVM